MLLTVNNQILGGVKLDRYYQLLETDSIDEKLIYNKALENNLNPTSLNIKGHGNFIALELADLKKMKKFDEAIDKEKKYVNYFLFTNDRFENLIKEAEKYGIEINNIKTSKTNEHINDEINNYIATKRYQELADLIDKTDIFVKKIEFAMKSNKCNMTVYDSGVCGTESKNCNSKKAKPLIKWVLNIACNASSRFNTLNASCVSDANSIKND